MKRNLLLYSILVCLFLCVIPERSAASHVVKFISNIDGLTNNSVNCIFEDTGHTVWIGTWDGLNAYDGRDIRTFRYSKSDPNTISNNIIRQIIELGDDLWIATDDGVNRLDKNNDKITRYYLRKENKIPNQEKSFILGKTADEKLFCLVKGVGLFFYNSKTEDFQAVTMDFLEQVKDFCIDRSNHMFFLLENGQVKYLTGRSPEDGVYLSDLRTVLPDTPIDRMFFSDNRFVLVQGGNLFLLNPDFTIEQHIRLDSHKTVSQVVWAGKDVYAGFIEGGCIRYNTENDTYTSLNEFPAHLSVFTLYPGSQDILWIGTDGHGVARYYRYETFFRTAFSNYPVRCFAEDISGNILVGTKGGGIKRLDTENNRLTDFLSKGNGLNSNSVYALRANKAGDLFIGTEEKDIYILMASTGKTERLVIPDKYPSFKAVYGMCFTNNDSLLWVGTSGYGLIRMDIKKEGNRYEVKGFRQYTSLDTSNPLNNDIVYVVVPGVDGHSVWFGTRGGGLNKIDLRDNRIKSLEDMDSNIQLTNNDVLCLLQDNEDFWIGTSYGLNWLKRQDNTFRLFPYADDKLKNKTVHGILKENEERVWFSTNQGLSCLDVESNQIKNYSLNDGLQNDEFSDGAFFKDEQGVLYFGGVGGVSYFDPQHIRLRQFEPLLVLGDLKVYDKKQNVNERIRNGILKLGYQERFVTFSFVAKDFINNENCEYAYRLGNRSEEWIYLGNNPEIVFAQLPPGTYLLEVKCTNGDRVWSDTVYSLVVKVAYPWWLGMPALIVYGILLILLILLIRSVVKNRIRLSRQILIDRMEKQHERGLYESKLNFFTDVAHEFFTPLTLIYTPVQYLIEKQGLDAGSRKYLEIIKNNAERMQKLITELMEFRKAGSGSMKLHPEEIEVKPFIEAAANNYVDILKENKIDFNLNIRNAGMLYSDRDALEKILFNLLSNAFKYTPRNGYIQVDVQQEDLPDGALCLAVRNSGKGLTVQQMAEIFDEYKIFETAKQAYTVSNGIGLSLTKKLAELLGGEISVDSELGKYVEFSVIIPCLSVRKEETLTCERMSEKEDRETDELKSYKDTVVLIVEDDESIRHLLEDVLSCYTIQVATDGIEALREIEHSHPDIIICDIVMPNMDGLELIDKLKSDVKTSYIPIVCISAKTSVEDQIDVYNHGADAYIAKPFHPKQVTSTVENLLSRQISLKDYFNSSLSSVKIKDGRVLHPEDEELIRLVTDFIQDNMDNADLSPASIAEFAGMSKSTLYRRFSEIMDRTPSEFVRSVRLEHAAKLLRTTKWTVSEIMYKSGFSNKSYFNREFLKLYGVSPKDYRNR